MSPKGEQISAYCQLPFDFNQERHQDQSRILPKLYCIQTILHVFAIIDLNILKQSKTIYLKHSKSI